MSFNGDTIDKNLGNIPSHWKLVKVKDLIENNILYKPMDGNHGNSHPKSDDYVETGIPFIMASDINNGKVDFVNCKYITKEQASSLRKGFAKEDDVLLTHKGTIGRTTLLKNIKSEYIMLTPQVTYYRVRDINKLNNCFLKYYFDYYKFQDILKGWAGSGSTRAYLGITAQSKLPVLLPSIKEQEAIAKFLSSLDEKIELNNQMNQTLEEIAQAIYKSWFVDFEPWQDGEFVDSELGKIPEGWEIQQIKDIGEVVLGKTPSTRKKENYGSKYPFITIPDTHDKMFIVQTEKKLSQLGHETQEKKLLPANSVSVSCIGTLGLVTINSEPSHTNQQINSIVCDDYYTEFVYFSMRELKQKLIKMGSGGTTIGNVNKGTFQKIKIINPKDDIIRDFNHIVNPMFKKIKHNLYENQTLTQLRDTLLPKLMSGEIRVPIEE